MSLPTIPTPSVSKGIVAFSALLLLVALVASTGIGAAHNPACHQTAGEDGPHYGGDQSSDAANENNPTLYGDDPANYPGSCSQHNPAPNTDN